MIVSSKKTIGVTIAAILAIIIVMPLGVGATPFEQQDPYGDGSVLLNISAVPDGDNWIFNYNVQNPGANLFFMSVGNMDPETMEIYDVVAFDAPLPADQGLSRLTSNSLLLYFMPYPGLPQDSSYDFSITYAGFIDSQSISFRTGGSGDTGGVQPNYTPEPASLFLLGSGILGLGLWRRRRKA